MCQNNLSLSGSSKNHPAIHFRRYALIASIFAVGLSSLVLPAQAQRNRTIGTPIATNYQGLHTANSYQPIPTEVNGATVTPPAVHVVPLDDALRESYRINPFYTKTLTCAGVVIVGSPKVSDWAFLEAAYTLDHQLHGSPSWVRDGLTTNKVRLAIIAEVEYTMDLPENQRNNNGRRGQNSAVVVSNASFQDTRSRGLGGMPDCSCAEENLLNLRADPYGGDGSPDAGENITIHEFSHTVASSIQRTQGRDGAFWTGLRKAFADAVAPSGRLGQWNASHQGGKVYASSNEQEYWAEGAQAWFDNANVRNSGGVHNRDDVKQKDPELAALLTEIYGDGPWKYHKTTAKNADGSTMRPTAELAHLQGLDEVRSQFPLFSFNNSPRVIAQILAVRAQTAGGGTNTMTTNAPAARQQ
jgi:hypothetical protein